MITFLTSRTGMVLLAFLGIAGFYLATAHTAHVAEWLPYGLVLLCPLMHLFMHGRHGNHAGHGQDTAGQSGDVDHHADHAGLHNGHAISPAPQSRGDMR
jgi:hypothetical protein